MKILYVNMFRFHMFFDMGNDVRNVRKSHSALTKCFGIHIAVAYCSHGDNCPPK